MGTMQEIRNLLADGTTVAEVIAEGYAPSSVYKAAGQVNRNGRGQRRVVVRLTMAQSRAHRPAGQSHGGSRTEDPEELPTELALLRAEAEQARALRVELRESKDRAQRLEEDAAQIPPLQAKVVALEAQAHETARLRERVEELENQLQNAASRQAEMRQLATQRQHDLLVQVLAQIKASAQAYGLLQQWKQIVDNWRDDHTVVTIIDDRQSARQWKEPAGSAVDRGVGTAQRQLVMLAAPRAAAIQPPPP